MRAFAFVSAISLLCAGGAEAAPRRVASLNLCTDELLLMLGAPDQIVSVTHLAQSPAETPLWKAARRYRKNDGSLVSVTAMRPDLVLTMGGGGRDRLRIAARLDIPTLDLPFPQSITDIRLSVKKVAKALGRERKGQEIIAKLDALTKSAPRRSVDTIWLGGGGRSMPPDRPPNGCRLPAFAKDRSGAIASRWNNCSPSRPQSCCEAIIAATNIPGNNAGSPILWPAARAVRARSAPMVASGPAWARSWSMRSAD